MLSAFNAGSTLNSVLIVPYVDSAPTVDGVEDSSWTFPQVGMFVYSDSTPPDNPADLSAYYKLAWNETGFYLFVHVIDDSIVTSHADSRRTDCIEIYIDGGNEDASDYDSNDVAWRAVALEDTLALCWNAGIYLRPPTYEVAWVENADGYDMELAIPDSGLEKQGFEDVQIFDLVPGTTIGWEIRVGDDDSVGGSSHGLRWWTAGEPWLYPSQLGTAKLGDTNNILEIPHVASAPIVDGVLDSAWTNRLVPEIAMSVFVDGYYPDSGRPDFTTYFRVACNEYGLYLFGRAVDDSIDVTHANDYQRDCWEIYFDGDNSKGTSYDGHDDVQWRFVYGDDSATMGPGPSECDVAWVPTADGYTWELEIPATTLADNNITLDLGDVIGFEVQASDNDGGDREGITKWWSESYYSWLDPSLFGTAIIALSNSDEVPEEINRNISLSAPAILTSAADITYTIPARSSVRVSVINVLGQVVDVPVNGVQSAGTYTASVDNDLANGVYLIKLDACGETSTDKVLLIK